LAWAASRDLRSTSRFSRACTTSQYALITDEMESFTCPSKFARDCARLRRAIKIGARLTKSPRLRSSDWLNWKFRPAVSTGLNVLKLLFEEFLLALKLMPTLVPVCKVCA